MEIIANNFPALLTNGILAKKADSTRGAIKVNETGKDSPSYSCTVKNETVNLFDFSGIIVSINTFNSFQ